MDQDKIKAWWFNTISDLIGRVLALTDEVEALRKRIHDLEAKETSHGN